MTSVLEVNQKLHPYVTEDYFAQKASDDKWARIWKLTATAAIISTLAIATLAFIYIPIFYSLHIALAAVVSVALIKERIWNKSEPYIKNSDLYKAFIKNIHLIEESEMPNQLAELGVTPGIEISKLESIYAFFLYMKDQQNEKIRAINLIQNKVSPQKELTLAGGANHEKKVIPQNYFTAKLDWFDADQITIAKHIQTVYRVRIDFVRKAAKNNLEAAFALKLMQSPYEKRFPEDFVQITPLNLDNALYQKAFGDPGADIFAKTKTKSYTAEELYDKDTTELAREIFELPTPPVPPKGWFN